MNVEFVVTVDCFFVWKNDGVMIQREVIQIVWMKSESSADTHQKEDICQTKKITDKVAATTGVSTTVASSTGAVVVCNSTASLKMILLKSNEQLKTGFYRCSTSSFSKHKPHNQQTPRQQEKQGANNDSYSHANDCYMKSHCVQDIPANNPDDSPDDDSVDRKDAISVEMRYVDALNEDECKTIVCSREDVASVGVALVAPSADKTVVASVKSVVVCACSWVVAPIGVVVAVPTPVVVFAVDAGFLVVFATTTGGLVTVRPMRVVAIGVAEKPTAKMRCGPMPPSSVFESSTSMRISTTSTSMGCVTRKSRGAPDATALVVTLLVC